MCYMSQRPYTCSNMRKMGRRWCDLYRVFSPSIVLLALKFLVKFLSVLILYCMNWVGILSSSFVTVLCSWWERCFTFKFTKDVFYLAIEVLLCFLQNLVFFLSLENYSPMPPGGKKNLFMLNSHFMILTHAFYLRSEMLFQTFKFNNSSSTNPTGQWWFVFGFFFLFI